MFDAAVTTWVLIGIIGLTLAAEGRQMPGWALFALAGGLGLLTKGPVVFVHLLSAPPTIALIIADRIVQVSDNEMSTPAPWLASVTAGLAALVWAALALAAIAVAYVIVTRLRAGILGGVSAIATLTALLIVVVEAAGIGVLARQDPAQVVAAIPDFAIVDVARQASAFAAPPATIVPFRDREIAIWRARDLAP